MSRIFFLNAALMTMLLMSPAASAGTIFGTGSPLDAIPGGTVIDFSSSATETVEYTSLTIENVTFSVDDVETGDIFLLTDLNGGSFNTIGRHLESKIVWQIKFDFLSEVDAFAFNLGGQDWEWTLEGFSNSGTLIDSLVIDDIGSSYVGEYYGLTGAGMSYATLTSPESRDFIMLDNFTYNVSVVPLPAGLPLFLTGLAGLGLLARQRKKNEL